MDALQVCAVMPAATAPLNPLAREFAPDERRASASLNPRARDFVPVGAQALNPLATEFLPWWHVGGGLSADAPVFVVTPPELYYPAAGAYDLSNATRRWPRQRVSNYSQHGRARFSQRVQRMNKEEYVRKTIYITNIDQTVTEEMLAQLFERCGTVVDCRLCGDPSSGFRFAFMEFLYQEEAFHALNLDGAIIGIFPLKVAPSRTAIMPIKHAFLPQSEEEKDRSSRTIYCTNIRKTVTPDELTDFCQLYFGPVSHVRLMGHDNHATKIAFVEFKEDSGAISALSSSGIYVKGLLIRFDH
ncbi:hypothetical protein ACQ4PT_016398 [Festuca glaucescens]